MIKSISWNNHEILGNLTLDFTKEDGTPYDTIILAGENGTGKTTILETLSAFLNLGSVEPFQRICYEINGSSFVITPNTRHSNIGFHNRTRERDGTTTPINTNRNNGFAQIERDLEDIRHYGCSYSKARSGFNTKKVTNTSTQQLDIDKYENDSTEDFTSIKQLLVDVDNQDNSDWMEISISGLGGHIDEFLRTSRLARFRSAFNNFFESLQFKKIDNSSPEEKKIIFEKHGRTVSIDSLSTGEKQIVFRGTHLLKNSRNIQGGVVLIDEPELSMHPKWQDKVLSYYRNLFTEDSEQKSQIIIATHSEYVLRAALNDHDNVLIIILNETTTGNIEPKRMTAPSVLPTITSAEVNYLAFDVVSNDYHIELYGYLQNTIAIASAQPNCSVKKCDRHILQQPQYNAAIHHKPSTFVSSNGTINYDTLPTYIRNAIDHPDPARQFSQEELRTSIELLIELCR